MKKSILLLALLMLLLSCEEPGFPTVPTFDSPIVHQFPIILENGVTVGVLQGGLQFDLSDYNKRNVNLDINNMIAYPSITTEVVNIAYGSEGYENPVDIFIVKANVSNELSRTFRIGSSISGFDKTTYKIFDSSNSFGGSETRMAFNTRELEDGVYVVYTVESLYSGSFDSGKVISQSVFFKTSKENKERIFENIVIRWDK